MGTQLPPIRRPMPSWALAEGLRRAAGSLGSLLYGCLFSKLCLYPFPVRFECLDLWTSGPVDDIAVVLRNNTHCRDPVIESCHTSFCTVYITCSPLVSSLAARSAFQPSTSRSNPSSLLLPLLSMRPLPLEHAYTQSQNDNEGSDQPIAMPPDSKSSLGDPSSH